MAKKFIDNLDSFYHLGAETIKALEIPDGILASAKEEAYGCIFGRDSLITASKLLSIYSLNQNPYYLNLTKKILQGLFALQGKEVNIESGEEPGKCIHEFRATGHDHLTKTADPPWYSYPDGTLRNFDSVDATPLFLIVLHRYLQKSKDEDFIISNEKNISSALNWIFQYGDKNNDGFIDYEKPYLRKSGGLSVHNWMDSTEAVFHEDEAPVSFPVAPVEGQAYVYLALRLWSSYFKNKDGKESLSLAKKSDELKKLFNKKFITGSPTRPVFSHAFDNKGKHLISGRSSLGHILWACLNYKDDNLTECIVEDIYIAPLVKRLLKPDIFEKKAGIRTLSKKSRCFDAMSYHNGSIWPHDNSLIAEGMEQLGFQKEATMIRKSIFRAYRHFNTPIELFVFRNNRFFEEYVSQSGRRGCLRQAWSAASMIADALALKSS